MKISVNWLKDFIELEHSTRELIQTLTNIGLLVDTWEENNGDVILEVETYANRPDTLGHLGIARELAAVKGLPLLKKEWPLTELEDNTSDVVDIQIWDEELCPRYCGMVVKGVRIGPSPDWLREKIEAVGLKPINNVVDVSNYVLFSTAHPIHTFDLNKLDGRKVIIRKAKNGEALIDLEGNDHKLTTDMLVIADEKKPVALAGVIGGEESAISEKTKDIFIESAYFNPVSVRKTSKKLGISTDASYRFERGADVSYPPYAAVMAASLLAQFGGKVSKGIFDVYPKPRKNKVVVLRHHRISELLGVDIDEDFVVEVLSYLGFRVESKQENIWQVTVPLFRIDIEREADLVEEIARFYGYDKIPSHLPPMNSFEPALTSRQKMLNKMRQVLFHYGFDEVVNFSFTSPETEELYKTDKSPIEIRNPVSSKASLLRTTLLGGLAENTRRNRNRGIEGVHIFESGNIFYSENACCKEQLSLALMTSGPVGDVHWDEKTKEADFFFLKGTCEALMKHLRYEPFHFKKAKHPHFEKEYCLTLYFKNERIGYLGLLDENILKASDMNSPVWGLELNLNALFEKQPQVFLYKPVIKYPVVSRDVSFIADQDVSYQDILEAIDKLSLQFLESVDLYDRFSGSPVAEGKISLSFRFVFRHPQRTLRTEEVEGFQEKIIKALKSAFNFQLREGGEN